MARPEKQSVAVAIRKPDEPNRILTVLRPADDEDLPNVWGLPAATLRPGEDWNTAIDRVGLEKLGVQLKPGAQLEAGTQQRRDYSLQMRLYEAQITKGTPFVPQPDNAVTQYAKWKWGTAEDLQPAAQRGSLCCRLYLRSANAAQS